MKSLSLLWLAGVTALGATPLACAQNLLANGNLDKVQLVEVVPGFFNPKPASWVNDAFQAITGPFENEMSSEPWAGPSPTPQTTDGLLNAPPHNTAPDWGVFFKPFTGNNSPNGPTTAHLYQDVPGTPGGNYALTGWAGAEANALMNGAVFAIEFRTIGGVLIQSVELNLLATLFVVNGQPFNYKQYSLNAVAPAGTAIVRARASMIGAKSNPSGGGQAFVVDDFTLIGPPVCPADINHDGLVNGLDLAVVLGNWNNSGQGDVDGSGQVNGADIALVLGAWGSCP